MARLSYGVYYDKVTGYGFRLSPHPVTVEIGMPILDGHTIARRILITGHDARSSWSR